MPSTQRSHSAPSADRRTEDEAENVSSPGHLGAARWHTTRTRQPQHRDESPGPSHEVVGATLQGSRFVTSLNSTVATSKTGQESDHMAAMNSPEGPIGENPWTRKTLLTLGTSCLTVERIYGSLIG